MRTLMPGMKPLISEKLLVATICECNCKLDTKSFTFKNSTIECKLCATLLLNLKKNDFK